MSDRDLEGWVVNPEGPPEFENSSLTELMRIKAEPHRRLVKALERLQGKIAPVEIGERVVRFVESLVAQEEKPEAGLVGKGTEDDPA